MAKRKNIDWIQAGETYIHGITSSQGVPIDYTFADIAGMLGTSRSIVSKMAQKYQWEKRRSNFREQLITEERDYQAKIRQELRDINLPSYTNFLSQQARMAYSIFGRYVKALADEAHPVKINYAEVSDACEKLKAILQFLEGRGSLGTVDEPQPSYKWCEMILELANIPDDRFDKKI